MHRLNREPIQIALLQRHAMDAFLAAGEELLTAPRASHSCVWPASAAAPRRWLVRGALPQWRPATVIERRALPGGLNTYGVAEYKLSAADSLREVEMIRRMGVEFRFGAGVETAADLEALESEFDYIFLGVGLGAMERLNIPGEEMDGVMNALELIAAYKTRHIRQLTGTVVVVGAGNTAIDAANAARRLGAETVYLLYRRGEAIYLPSTLSMSMPSRRACSSCGGVSQPPSVRMPTEACCWIRSRYGNWTRRFCRFPIRNSPLPAIWSCLPSPVTVYAVDARAPQD